ncbi:MAG: alkaline phosphatase family protein [Planctomycetes bacterium]|nr:alkaline phosphatase family protein [Planctomycetota bacterium]
MLRFLIIIAAFFAAAIPFQSSQPARTVKKKVLMIGIDGFRADVLERSNTPNLHALMANGCYTTEARAGEKTVSGPGWSSVLTGVWFDKHRVPDNDFKNPNYKDYPHFFARLREARPELKLASVVDWQEIDKFILASADADFRFVFDYKNHGDENVASKSAELLTKEDPDVLFAYFADLDEAGHANGFHAAVSEYQKALQTIDAQIGTILSAMRARPGAATEDWLVIVTSDHGGTIDGNHGRDIPEHRKIPFIVSGAAAARGKMFRTVNQVDAAPTAMLHLGIIPKQSWALDGRPVGFPTLTPMRINMLFNGNAETGTPAVDYNINAQIPGWTDTGSMTLINYDAKEGFPTGAGPGSPGRGRAFFAGGKSGEASISQVMTFEDIAKEVDAGQISFQAGGFFGGFAEQRDCAWLSLTFLDETGGEIYEYSLSPVTLARRKAESEKAGIPKAQTGLWPVGSPIVNLPRRARHVRVTLHAEAGDGDNDGYADDLLFMFIKQ